MPDNINVFLVDFPRNVKCHEAICKNEDGTYSVFIDARLSATAALAKYNHAVKHIENGDFEKQGNATELEAVAHGM